MNREEVKAWYNRGHTNAKIGIKEGICLLLCEAETLRDRQQTFSYIYFYWEGYIDEINGQSEFKL